MNNLTSREIGHILRDLRVARKYTGMQLAQLSGVSQSKISKLEHGKTTIIAEQLERLLNILDAPVNIRQQVIGSVSTAHAETQAFRFNLASDDLLKFDQSAKHIQIYVWAGVPALLQTIAVRKAMLRHIGYPEDVLDSRAAQIIRRQDAIWDSKKRYSILIGEAGLYEMVATPHEHIVQLDRLERCIGYDSPKLGIVPFRAGTGGITASNFTLYDDTLLYRELGTDTVETTDARILQDHVRLFEDLQHRAVYEHDARLLVRDAVRYFETRT